VERGRKGCGQRAQRQTEEEEEEEEEEEVVEARRGGNLLTVFDPCGRVQPDTDLFEPWRLEGSRLTLVPGRGKPDQVGENEKRSQGGRRGDGTGGECWSGGGRVGVVTEGE
jgi:hypothetical protein